MPSEDSQKSDFLLYGPFGPWANHPDLISKLCALSEEYAGDLGESLWDIQKDVNNHFKTEMTDETAMAALGVVTLAVAKALAAYLGNFQLPYRPWLLEYLGRYLAEMSARAAIVIQKEQEKDKDEA